MSKHPIIATMIAAFICGGLVAFLFLEQRHGPRAVESAESPPIATSVTTTSGGLFSSQPDGFNGCGWSTLTDTRSAVKAAASHAIIDDANAGLTLVYYSPQHAAREVVTTIRSAGIAAGQVLGESTHEGILSPDGYHRSDTGVIGMMATRAESMRVGVGGASFEEHAPSDAARLALRNALAIADPAATVDDISMIVLCVTLPNEEAVVAALEEETGVSVPLIGGTAAGSIDAQSRERISNWSIIANDEVYDHGVGLAVLLTPEDVAWSHGGGFRRTTMSGTVTRTDGRLVHEIDGRPAVDVYDEWMGGRIHEAIERGEKMTQFCTLYPLARPTGSGSQFVRVWPSNDPSAPGSLRTGSSLAPGDQVFLSEGNWNQLLNHFATVPNRARASIPGYEPAAGLLIYCGGALSCIPDAERPRMSQLVNRSLEDIPWIGVFAWGEQGNTGAGKVHGNLSAGTILFPASRPE